MRGTLIRLLIVPLAALLAAAAACVVLVSLGLERFTHATYGRQLDADSVNSVLDWIVTGLHWLSAATVVPSLALIIIGEVAGIRSWLYYVLGGGIALAATPLLTAYNDGIIAALPAAAVWQVLATAGFAGGFTYWLIAGRSA